MDDVFKISKSDYLMLLYKDIMDFYRSTFYLATLLNSFVSSRSGLVASTGLSTLTVMSLEARTFQPELIFFLSFCPRCPGEHSSTIEGTRDAAAEASAPALQPRRRIVHLSQLRAMFSAVFS